MLLRLLSRSAHRRAAANSTATRYLYRHGFPQLWSRGESQDSEVPFLEAGASPHDLSPGPCPCCCLALRESRGAGKSWLKDGVQDQETNVQVQCQAHEALDLWAPSPLFFLLRREREATGCHGRSWLPEDARCVANYFHGIPLSPHLNISPGNRSHYP